MADAKGVVDDPLPDCMPIDPVTDNEQMVSMAAEQLQNMSMKSELDPKNFFYLCFVGDPKKAPQTMRSKSVRSAAAPVDDEEDISDKVMDDMSAQKNCWAFINTKTDHKILLDPGPEFSLGLDVPLSESGPYNVFKMEPNCYVTQGKVKMEGDYGLYWRSGSKKKNDDLNKDTDDPNKETDDSNQNTDENKYAKRRCRTYVIVTYDQLVAAAQVGSYFWHNLPEEGRCWQLVNGEGDWTDPEDGVVWDMHALFTLTPEQILLKKSVFSWDDYRLLTLTISGTVEVTIDEDDRKRLAGGKRLMEYSAERLTHTISTARIENYIVPPGVVLGTAIQIPSSEDPRVFIDEDKCCPVCQENKNKWKINQCGCLTCQDCFEDPRVKTCPRCRAEKKPKGLVSFALE